MLFFLTSILATFTESNQCTMNQNEQIVFDFYSDFQNLNAEKMVSHYSDNIQFEDPAFGKLHAEDAKNMWRMLCENAKDLKITFTIIESKENMVKAHWNAEYTFSRTGRMIYNSINAHFIFENGLIISHKDHFDLWKWSRQALGTSGVLFGWSPLFQKKLQKTTAKMLLNFMTTR